MSGAGEPKGVSGRLEIGDEGEGELMSSSSSSLSDRPFVEVENDMDISSSDDQSSSEENASWIGKETPSPSKKTNRLLHASTLTCNDCRHPHALTDSTER